MFQSPQWGSNSKGLHKFCCPNESWFQSPQWGSNSKGTGKVTIQDPEESFSPRNGEVILKTLESRGNELIRECFSPRNGEVILKPHLP